MDRPPSSGSSSPASERAEVKRTRRSKGQLSTLHSAARRSYIYTRKESHYSPFCTLRERSRARSLSSSLTSLISFVPHLGRVPFSL